MRSTRAAAGSAARIEEESFDLPTLMDETCSRPLQSSIRTAPTRHMRGEGVLRCTSPPPLCADATRGLATKAPDAPRATLDAYCAALRRAARPRVSADYIVRGRREAVNPQRCGTKAAVHYSIDAAAGHSQVMRLRDRAPAQFAATHWRRRRATGIGVICTMSTSSPCPTNGSTRGTRPGTWHSTSSR